MSPQPDARQPRPAGPRHPPAPALHASTKTPASLAPCVLALVASLAIGCSRDRSGEATPASSAPTDGTTLRTPAGRDAHDVDPRSANATGVLDARPLAGQGEIGVRAVLGNPTACQDVAKGRTCRYAHAATDITYIDGAADWIVVDDIGGAPFSPAALARVGLPTDEEPIEASPQMLRWQNLAGYREVTLYPGPDGRAGRIEMKMATL